MTTLLAVKPAQIDFRLAESILDRLGYSLQDLSLDYGDVVLAEGDISHQLYYSSEYSNCNLLGYIHCENGIYFINQANYQTAEQAALELIPQELIARTIEQIENDRANSPDYF